MENNSVMEQRTKKELLHDLYSQLHLLKIFCHHFDEGDIDFAKEIALKIRVLLSDGKEKSRSRSLFQQLESAFIFDRPDFINLNSPYTGYSGDEKTYFVRSCLVRFDFRVGKDAPNIMIPHPLYKEKKKKYSYNAFSTWWDKKPVLLLNDKDKLTRRDIILFLADQDGGAHIDPHFEEKYALLKRGKAKSFCLPIETCLESAEIIIKEYHAQIDTILPNIARTIAEEVLDVIHNEVIPICEKYK